MYGCGSALPLEQVVMVLRLCTGNCIVFDGERMVAASSQSIAARHEGLKADNLSKSDSLKKRPKNKFILTRIISMFVGEQALPRSTVVSSFIINLLGLALPLVMLQIYDRILANKSVSTLAFLMLGLSLAIIIEAFLKVTRAYLMSWTATKQSFRSDLDAITRLVYAPSDAYHQKPANVWMDRLESLNQFNAFSTGQSRLILLDLPFVAIYLSVIFLIAGNLGFVLVGSVLAFAFIIVMRAKALRRVLEERSNHNNLRDDFIAETLGGIETVKAMIIEPQMQRRFERLQQTASEITHKSITLSNELQIYSSLLGNIILVSVVSVGALSVIGGTLSIGTLACCTLLTSRVLQPVMRGIQVLMELENAQLAKEKAQALFDLPEVKNDDEGQVQMCRGEIELRDASFTYSGKDEPTLSDINLYVARGEIIGIRGEHASGKSTLLKMISGELAPSAGECLVDGKKIAARENIQLAENITYVSQKSAIFEGSVMDNITMFRHGPEIIKSARWATRMLDLEDDIHRMPLGYDTLIGQGIAEVLPAGMVQRIVIARALALKPAILLFNEANSMLDMKSDASLKDAFSRLKGKMTIVMISNRPSLLAIADHQFTLDDGLLQPQGAEKIFNQQSSLQAEIKTA